MGISRLKIHLGWHRRGHICVPLPFPGPVYSAASQSSVAAAAVRLCVTGRRRAGCVTAVGRNTEETSDSPEEQEKLFSLPSACIGSGPQTAPPPSCVDEEGSFPTVSKGVACRRTEGFWRPRSPEVTSPLPLAGGPGPVPMSLWVLWRKQDEEVLSHPGLSIVSYGLFNYI
uniref:uncharacterized protein LOC124055978 isoform X2 n=1 Tax=Scatophagus argus TaxID=75038 RepID=UPI001ED7E0EA|nr:uncharacterized protein LOC124055978 isoform X2 [Scatophagus argus]XP_046238944.1 uncharacterized protein LOC124055978 isoform X2 [Scatophagus argus]